MTMTSDEADVEIEVATIAIPTWLMREYELPSREMHGRILQTSQKAMLFDGVMNTREATHCLRDGTALEGTEKRGGYCAKCQAEIGADPSNLNPRQIWLPKKHVTMLDGSGSQPDDEGPADTSDVTITVRVNKAYLEAQADRFDEHSKMDLKSIAGRRWVPRRKLWRYPATPATAYELWLVVKKYRHNVSQGFRDLVDAHEARGTAAILKDTAAADLPDIPVTSDMTPWEHQLQGYHFGSSLDAFGFYAVMGAGKTRTAIDLLQNSEARKILIVCPRSVVGVWPREFRKWAVNPEAWMQVPLRAEKIGSVDDRTEWAKAHLAQAEAHDLRCVIIINFEAVWREPFATWAQKEKWDYIVVDEAHRIKSAGSKVSQFMGRLSRRTRRRLSLTGTPMPNNPTDVFGQYRFLDPGIFGTSFVTFKNRYAIMGGYKDKALTGFRVAPMLKDGSPNPHYDPQLAVEFHDKMFSIAMEVGEEVLDLPPLSEYDKPFELSKKARRVYEEMENEKYVDLAEHGVLGNIGEILEKIELGEATEDEMLTGAHYRLHGGTESSAKNVLTMLLRLQQITGGVMRDDMGYDHVIDDGKKVILEDILEDIGDEPIVVFCRFKHDLKVVQAAADKAKKRYGELSGSRRDAITEDSEMAPNIDVAGVQIQSGGTGIDLTRARYVAYYSLTHSLGEYDQSMKRVHRPGQTRPVIVYHFVAEDTVDRDVYQAIIGKGRIVDFVMRGLRNRRPEVEVDYDGSDLELEAGDE